MAATALALALAAPAPAQKDTEQQTQDPVAAVWEYLADPGAYTKPTLPGIDALDQAIQELDLQDTSDLPRAALAFRLQQQLGTLPPDDRAPLVKALSAHENLAAEVAFLIGPDDHTPEAYAVLRRLLDAYGERVAELAPLAAAICVVHDEPRDRRVNENTVPLIDPVDLFGYYEANERSMLFRLDDLPGPTLVYLADAAGTLDEYDWARKRYSRDRNIGNRYQEITYDSRAFHQEGAEKRVTEAGGYSLQTIRQLGGICADQAYFALSVGKACGVPTCCDTGKGGAVAHAWLGFLQRDGSRGARWNFSEGRYKEYEDVRGSVTDPQTWETIPDAQVAVTASSISIAKDRRWQSMALIDAANRVAARAYSRSSSGLPPETIAEELDMLEAAVGLDPGNVRAWLFARNLVATPGSTLEQKERWTRAVDQLTAQVYPDFAFFFVAPIFDAETDQNTRFKLWDWAATRFSDRPDLAAQARLVQTRIMIDQGRKQDAVAAARAVFDQYGGSTVLGVEALSLAEQLLDELGQHGAVLDMYEKAFRKLRQPGRMQQAFLRQTSWFQIGARYAELLTRSGDARKAEAIRRRLAD